MSATTEGAAVLCGTTRVRYEVSVDPVLALLFVEWVPPSDATQRALIALAAQAAGTVLDGTEVSRARQRMLHDWYVRTWAPSWMDVGGPIPVAAELRRLRPGASVQAAGLRLLKTVEAERKRRFATGAERFTDQVKDAARRAVSGALWGTMNGQHVQLPLVEPWNTVWKAVWDTGYESAWLVACEAARVAPRVDMESRAYATLRPTVDRLVPTAIRLIQRMLRVRSS